MILRNHKRIALAGARWRRGFTSIELATVIVILGVLTAITIPIYLDYRIDAATSACKRSLGLIRAAIVNYHTYSATVAGGESLRYPSLSDLTEAGGLLQTAVPDNPFDQDDVPNNVEDATGQPKGALVGTNGGWCYDPTTGHFWANTVTKSAAENTF